MLNDINKTLSLIKDGFPYEIEEVVIPNYSTENEETIYYVSVENPDFQEDLGNNANYVIQVKG